MMFLSQRDMLSIDLYLADAQTGRGPAEGRQHGVRPALLEPRVHQLGRRVVAGQPAVRLRGRAGRASPTLVLLDVDSRQHGARDPVRGSRRDLQPVVVARRAVIAFSAQQGGWTDLFVYDLRAGRTRRLTHDAFADLQPAWSPDGNEPGVRERPVHDAAPRLADRRLPTRAAGRARAGGCARSTGAGTGKNINPQWSRDGQIYFVSDRTGHQQRLPGEPRRRRAAAGDERGDGRQRHHPAQSGDLARPGRQPPGLQRLREQQVQHLRDGGRPGGRRRAAGDGRRARSRRGCRRASDSSDRDRRRCQQNPTIGVGAAHGREHARTHPKLSLDMVGQPYVGAGVDPYGMFAGGGIASRSGATCSVTTAWGPRSR